MGVIACLKEMMNYLVVRDAYFQLLPFELIKSDKS